MPTSTVPTIPLMQSTYGSQQQKPKQAFKHADQSRSSKRRHHKQSTAHKNDTKSPHRSIALYNQKNGRIGKFINLFQQKKTSKYFIERVVKNRLNVVSDDADESIVSDEEEEESQSEWV